MIKTSSIYQYLSNNQLLTFWETLTTFPKSYRTIIFLHNSIGRMTIVDNPSATHASVNSKVHKHKTFYIILTVVESDIAKIQNIGCFKDSTPAAIPSLENIDEVLEGNYYERSGAILRCAEAAYKRGFDVFAIQNGKCLSSSTASMSFAKYGNTKACGIHGRGGVLANEVYRITSKYT